LSPVPLAAIATAFAGWRRYESGRRALMKAELERIAAQPAISPDLADIVAHCIA
jgi:aminopeptidase N